MMTLEELRATRREITIADVMASREMQDCFPIDPQAAADCTLYVYRDRYFIIGRAGRFEYLWQHPAIDFETRLEDAECELHAWMSAEGI